MTVQLNEEERLLLEWLVERWLKGRDRDFWMREVNVLEAVLEKLLAA